MLMNTTNGSTPQKSMANEAIKKLKSGLATRILNPAVRQMESAVSACYDFYENLLNLRSPMIPPRRLNYNFEFRFDRAGYERRFIKDSENKLNMLKELAGLTPHSRVFEIASGVGNGCFALTKYLTHDGGYFGIEIVEASVNWCKKNITERHPNFEFKYMPIQVDHYDHRLDTETGRNLSAASVRFPVEDESKDVQFSTSLFTHLDFDSAQHYLNEISRSLKPGGKCLNTFFLLDDGARANTLNGLTDRVFAFEGKGFFYYSKYNVLAGTAFTEDVLRKMYKNAGLKIINPIIFGEWSGRPNKYHYQDIVVAEKSASA